MLDRYLSRLERKFGRFAIPRLMSIILVGMVVIYCFDIIITFNPDAVASVSSLFTFDLEQIRAGQIWRVITFIFIPPDTGILFAAFVFYFIWLYGVGLENRWGSFKFNVYYLIGMLGAIIVGFITGYATNVYLDLTLFLAFAILYPNYEILLFFFIPIKVKWIGLIDGIGLVILFILGNFATRMLLLVSVANLLLFFGEGFVTSVYYRIRRGYYRLKRKSAIKQNKRDDD